MFFLLANVLEKLKNKCKEDYGLDPSHYLDNSDLSCDSVLRMTKVELELISYIDLYLFFEKGVRGDVHTFLIKLAKLTVNV